MPATMVGSANGRSMRAPKTRLPGNSSRTSTQAIRVPTPTLTTTTTRATANVSRSAARACGVVAACQNGAAPSRDERHTTAASGSSTIKLRYRVTVPRSSAAPLFTGGLPLGPAWPPVAWVPASLLSPPDPLFTGGLPLGSAWPPCCLGSGLALEPPGPPPLVALLAANRDAHLALDFDQDAGLLVEEPLGHLVPAADVLDGEQPGRLGEVRGDPLVHRPVALLGEDLLAGGGAGEVDEGPGRLLVPALGGDRDRVLDQDGLVGDDVVDRLVLLLGVDGLVLVGDHHVALAADEGLDRLTGGLVLHRHVAEQPLQVVDRLLVGPALLDLGAVGRHHVPAGGTRAERVRRDPLDARFDQVVPGADLLRVALAGDQHHHRVGDHALVLAGVPVPGDQAGVDQPVHVGRERQRHHVGGPPVGDRPA